MLYNQAKTFRVLPSEFLGMGWSDPVATFSLNTAVWYFGTSLEAALDRNPKPTREDRKEEQRRTRILNRWIPKASDAEATEKAAPKKFATPRPTK